METITRSDTKQPDQYLTPEEVVARYKDKITLGTLANWRSTKQGPEYCKVGGRVLYSHTALKEWENRRTLGRSEPGIKQC